MTWMGETPSGRLAFRWPRSVLLRMRSDSTGGEDRFRAGYNAALRDIGLRDDGIDIHRQIELEGIEVDAGMAPLLDALWGLGVKTQFSCQGDPERYIPHQASASQHDAHIVFAELNAAVRFMQLTLDLLGYVPFKDGWMELTPMQPFELDWPARGRVGWPPILHDEITERWVAYARRLLAGEHTRGEAGDVP